MADVEAQNGSGNGVKAAPSPAISFSAFKPQLVVASSKAADAVQFYKDAFGAEEIGRTSHPKRKIDQELPLLLAADLKLGSSVFSVSASDDESLKTGNGCVFTLETEDVQGAISKACTAGAVAEGEILEGEDAAGLSGKVKDPYGFLWTISSAPKATETAPATTVTVEA